MKYSKGHVGESRLTLEHYVQILRSHRVTLQERYRVREIGIFGSFARGEQRRRSDIDILVDFDEIPDLFMFIGLADYLEEILRIKVDLVRKPVIRKEFREQILREVVYA